MQTILRATLSFTAVLALMTTPVRAELVGLPVADTANTIDPGTYEFTPGGVTGGDISFYGLRQSFSFTEGFRGFLDLGAIDFDEASTGFGADLGAMLCLGATSVADLALRPAIYYANTDTTHAKGCSLSLVTSDESLIDGLFLYGGIGLDYSETSMDLKKGAHRVVTEVNPLISLGLIYNFTPSVAIYLEGTYVTTPLVSFGIKLH